MPDWTYHPFFKPFLFRLGGEDARALTLKLLEIQSRTSIGRRIFRLFGHGAPSARFATRAFGIDFPSPIGLAPGIDTHASATSVLQELGFGFVVVGPVGVEARPHTPDVGAVRIESRCAIVESARAPAPSAASISSTIFRAKEMRVPIGVALTGKDLVAAILACERAHFFTVPASSDIEHLRAMRAATTKPILVRIPAGLNEVALDRIVDAALEAKMDGAVVLEGVPCPLLHEGSIDGPFLLEESMAVVSRIAKVHGDRFPIVGAGGVFTPDDALALLDAGAKLVELHAGLVYAGPGFPARILHAIERSRLPAARASRRKNVAHIDEHSTRRRKHLAFGSALLTFTGLVLLGSGIAALVLAATVKLLPYDVHYLGMSMNDLCAQHACRIVHFMAHDRVSWGGSMLAIAVTYLYLARGPVRRGEAWAWWALTISGAIGFGSFLTYLGFGYLDVWHGRATLALIPFFLTGLIFSFRGIDRPRGLSAIARAFRPAWRWSPAGLGRWLVAFAAFGMMSGGLTIMFVGMTQVFVPTDLEFMQVTRAQLDALNPRLVSLIAHDRAGFGGGLCSGGSAVMLTLFCGLRPGDRALWWALSISGTVGFATAIGVHPIVGYTSFVHLLPAYAGAIAFMLGMILLRKPLLWERGERFSDV